jgi:hypothetical protein
MKHGKWTWLSWILVGMIVLAALIEFVFWLLQMTGPSSFHSWVSALGWGVAIPAVFSTLAALIIARQPGNRVGWLMMLVALASVAPFGTILNALPSPPAAITPVIFLLIWFDAWSWIPIIFPIFLIPLNFPSGRPPTPRWNWVNRLALGLWLFFIAFTPFIDTITYESGNWSLPNPIGFIPTEVVDGPFMIFWGAGLLTLVSASVVSLFVRYRRAGNHERQQIQWLLYAGALFVVVYASAFVISDAVSQFDGLGNLLLLLSILAIPIAIAIAILRYRLYDIDVIIRKTLQYGVLTLLLALVYMGSVVLLQGLVENITEGQSPIVIVISTLAIIALFNPLRHRIQDFIDRRFFRARYDAEQTLARFGAVARDEVDMEKLANALLNAVEETMQPESKSLWLVLMKTGETR